MSKKKKNRGIGGLFDAQTMAVTSKGDLKASAIKMLNDTIGVTSGVVASAVTGPTIGVFAGLGLLFLSHYLDDKTGVVRIGSAALLGYSLAKSYQNLADALNKSATGTVETTVKSRLSDLKEEVMAALFLNKIFKKKDAELKGFEDNQVEGLDLSALDMFNQFNEQEAAEFESRQMGFIEGYDDEDNQIGSMDFAYSIIDEEIND